MKTSPVLVTGGNGYVAGWVIKQLLELGHLVHVTVRVKADVKKYQYLYFLERESEGQLKIFEVDLANPQSLEPALVGVEVVYHLASERFLLENKKEPEPELIALDARLAAFYDVLKAGDSLKQVITLQPLNTVMPGLPTKKEAKAGEVMVESISAQTVNSRLTPQMHSIYYGKMREEQLLKSALATTSIACVCLRADLLLGPALTVHTKSKSFEFIRSLLMGKLKAGVPDAVEWVQDVRLAAIALVQAQQDELSSGDYILPGTWISCLTLTQQLDAIYPKKYKLPKKTLSFGQLKQQVKRVGISPDYLKAFANYQPQVEVSDAFSTLAPIELDSLLEDMVEQMKKSKAIR